MGICLKHNVTRTKRGHCAGCVKEYDSSLKKKQWKRARRITDIGKMQNSAHRKVNRAIVKGELTRLPCIICANPKSEAHHAYGYEPENRLNVIFLCRQHHKQADKDPYFNEYCKSIVAQNQLSPSVKGNSYG